MTSSIVTILVIRFLNVVYCLATLCYFPPSLLFSSPHFSPLSPFLPSLSLVSLSPHRQHHERVVAVSRQEKSHPSSSSSSSSFGADEGKVEMTESSEVDFEGFLTEESMRTGSTCTRGKRKKGEVVEERGELLYKTVFSPEFTGQRVQILSHDHTPHLECSDCQYQTFAACVLYTVNKAF